MQRLSVEYVNEAKEYYLYNGTGNVTQTTAENGSAFLRYTYDAFGNISSIRAPMTVDIDDLNRYTYNGEDYDYNTGLQYLRARYYDTSVGSFISQDTYLGDLLNPLSQNRYTYAHNSPVMFDDPSGHQVAVNAYISNIVSSNDNDMSGDNSNADLDNTAISDKVNDSCENVESNNCNKNYTTYNREAAIAYAQKWYDGSWLFGRNKEYYNYRENCANFVSQCVFSGGITMCDDWHSYRAFNLNKYWWDPRSIFSRNYWYDWDVAESWRLAAKQYEYFSNPLNGYINGEVIIIDAIDQIDSVASDGSIQPGDLMYFVDDGKVHHATIINDVRDGMIYYSGNTQSRWDQPLSASLGDEQVYIVRINDIIPLAYDDAAAEQYAIVGGGGA